MTPKLYLSWHIYQKPLTESQKIVAGIKQARKEYLALLSVFNELSGDLYALDEIIYRLLAAEKLYHHWLKLAREHGVSENPQPFLPPPSSRGYYFDHNWYLW